MRQLLRAFVCIRSCHVVGYSDAPTIFWTRKERSAAISSSSPRIVLLVHGQLGDLLISRGIVVFSVAAAAATTTTDDDRSDLL